MRKSREGVGLGLVRLEVVSEKAIKVTSLSDTPCSGWVPKAVIHDDSEIYGDQQRAGDEGKLVVFEWFAEQRDWL